MVYSCEQILCKVQFKLPDIPHNLLFKVDLDYVEEGNCFHNNQLMNINGYTPSILIDYQFLAWKW